MINIRFNCVCNRARMEPTFVGSVRLYFEKHDSSSVRFDFTLKNMVRVRFDRILKTAVRVRFVFGLWFVNNNVNVEVRIKVFLSLSILDNSVSIQIKNLNLSHLFIGNTSLLYKNYQFLH